MKKTQLLFILCFPCCLYGQQPEMKQQLKIVLDKYAQLWSYFVSEDAKLKLQATRLFPKLFADGAPIYEQTNHDYLSVSEFQPQISNFNIGATLQMEDIQFCRNGDALFYVFYRQVYNGKCLQCGDKEDLPPLYHRMSVVKINGNWLISKIERWTTQARQPDDDDDGIPNQCDVCPKTVGKLEYFGDDPYDSCKKNPPTPTPIPPPPSPFGIEMVAVQGGTFQMGSNDSEASSDEKPVHTVTVGNFSIGKYEVTQAQWRAVMGTNPSHFKNCDNCPVEQVSWDDIQQFLSKLYSLTGKRYRLPTEAEWEFAARGGTKSNGSKYSGSNDLNIVAWNYGNSGYKTHPVGGKSANELGIYDMSGNVWEWCADLYDGKFYSNAAATTANPTNTAIGTARVLRGGSWLYDASYCRVARRGNFNPTRRGYYYGFRVVAFP